MEQKWNEVLLENFALTLGSSLDELRNEYDDMIRTFELQKNQLRIFTTPQSKIEQQRDKDEEQPPSPAPSNTSRHLMTKDDDKKSKAKKYKSFRVTGSILRKKLSIKTASSCPSAVLDRTESKGSIGSQKSESRSTSKSLRNNDKV